MQPWEPKKFGKGALRTYVLPAAKRAAGLYIATINGVTASVWENSQVQDPAPSAILNGNAIRNAAAFRDGSVNIDINQSLSQLFKDGVLNCTYVISLDLTLSNLEPFQEDITMMIIQYVPKN